MRSVYTLSCALAACALGCGGTTGSELVTFRALATGPSDADGQPLTFTNSLGADVTLTRARLRVGAVYLNQSVPVSGAASEPCYSPGIYLGEAFGPIDVDLLSPDLVAFPSGGEGTRTPAKTAEVWLSGGSIDAAADPTVILEVAGSAVQAGVSYPFTAALTIGQNRQPSVSNPALPGANPICHQRIVKPILVDLTPSRGGTLLLRIDPRAMFVAVDFSQAEPVGDPPSEYRIPDTGAGAGGALYRGLRSNFGVYAFEWEAAQ